MATIRNGVYYGVRRERFGWRAMLYCFDHGRRLWQMSQGLPVVTKTDAAKLAKDYADYFAEGHKPKPAVHPWSPTILRLASASEYGDDA